MSVVYLVAHGAVQGATFRQTVVRCAMKRGLVAGATNNRNDWTRVDIALQGDPVQIQEMVDAMKSGRRLNSRGACCHSVEVVETGTDPLQHEVNSSNCDHWNWKEWVEFYL
jgi:acylphosphatase